MCQNTIIASNAEQHLNTDTWDDELNADSRFNANSANSFIRTATPSNAIVPTVRQPSRQRSRLHCICQARQECCHFRCRHRFQHRLDCIVIFSVHSHRVAADHRKELQQFLCRGTVSEYVTRIELSVNTFHFEVSFLQFLLQPTMPAIQMFHSSDASLVANSLAQYLDFSLSASFTIFLERR